VTHKCFFNVVSSLLSLFLSVNFFLNVKNIVLQSHSILTTNILLIFLDVQVAHYLANKRFCIYELVDALSTRNERINAN